MLTDTKIKSAAAKGKTYRLSDFQGLYLEVSPKGAKYWRLKYRINRKEKRLAIGVYPEVSLKEARKKKEDARVLLSEGKDPSIEKHLSALRGTEEENSFKYIAENWFTKMLDSWAPSTTKKRRALLNNDLLPSLGKRQVQDITTPDIVTTLLKISNRGATDSAHNAKQVLNQIFSYAKQLGKVEYNIATDLNNIIPAKRTKHRPAITEPIKLSKLLVGIDNMQGTLIISTALKLVPLLFQRPGEICAMEWSEIDFDSCVWTIPKEKKKERNHIEGDHIVPLSKQSVFLLEKILPLTGKKKFVFPNQRDRKKCIPTESLNKAIRKIGFCTQTEQCAHGFRAVARTLLDEQLNFRLDWIEQQLAHNVRDSLGRAYNRAKYLPERHAMMQTWSNYINQLKEDYLKSNSLD